MARCVVALLRAVERTGYIEPNSIFGCNHNLKYTFSKYLDNSMLSIKSIPVLFIDIWMHQYSVFAIVTNKSVVNV